MCLLQKKKKNHIFPGQEARLRFATQPSRCITGDNFALLSSPRCHQGRRLGSDEDVHATSQHRGKITPLHQVSVIGVFCLFFFSPLSLQFPSSVTLGRITARPSSHAATLRWVLLCRGNKSICYSPFCRAVLLWKAWWRRSRTGSRNGRRRLISWTKTMPKVNEQETYTVNSYSSVCWTGIDACLASFLSTEYKRSRQEIKRKSLDTIKLQKKARKGEKKREQVTDD